MSDHRSGSGRAVLGVAALVAVALVAGCSSSSKGATATTTAGSGATSTTAAGGDQSSELNAMASAIKGGKNVTFKAVYATSGTVASGPITIEQEPGKSLLKVSDGEVLDNGSTTYYCSTATPASCFPLATGGVDPLAGETQLFNPDTAVSAIQAAEAEAAAHQSGYNVSFSTQSFAGVATNCVTVTSSSQTAKYCVTKDGVLAYGGTSTVSFQLSSYSTSVSAGDFTLPAGATIQTIP